MVNVTSASGTDIDIELCARDSVDQTCLAHEPGTWSPAPLVETAVGPKADGANGIVIVDGAAIPLGAVERPITMVFERGRVVSIQGGPQANQFREMLASFEHPNVYQLVELGFGLNRGARIGRGIMVEDESQFATIHLGLGQGHTFGLDVAAPAHFDVVLAEPIVTLDSRLLLSKGQYHFGPFATDIACEK